MATTRSTSYAATKARNNKAIGVLDRIEKHLLASLYARYPDGEFPYAENDTAMRVIAILNGAAKTLNAEIDAARKAEGIGNYIPYGRPAPRR